MNSMSFEELFMQAYNNLFLRQKTEYYCREHWKGYLILAWYKCLDSIFGKLDNR